MTHATAVGAADAAKMSGLLSAERAGCRLESEPMADRAREVSFHNTGVCLMNRLIRRRTDESHRAGTPRQVDGRRIVEQLQVDVSTIPVCTARRRP